MALISCERASKYFRRSAPTRLIRERVSEMAKAPDPADRFYALRDVTFKLDRGESLGVIGRNGAGKSTLLNMVTGLVPPDEGTVTVGGKVAALLELGAGFHMDLTGYENLELNAALIGLTSSQVKRFQDEIVEFSELREYMEQTLRTYSTGMIVRLAFSVAVQLDAEVLVIDEVLAVGDQAFQTKCLDRIRAKQKSGQSLMFVSHSPASVVAFCDRALWLDGGRVMRYGPVAEVANAYHEFCSLTPVAVPEPEPKPPVRKIRKVAI